MTCKKCGAILPDNAKFCSKCGTLNTPAIDNSIKKCGSCGAVLNANAVFCSSCGTKIDATPSQNQTTPENNTQDTERMLYNTFHNDLANVHTLEELEALSIRIRNSSLGSQKINYELEAKRLALSEKKYQNALKLKNTASCREDILKAQDDFRKLGDYKNSTTLAAECSLMAKQFQPKTPTVPPAQHTPRPAPAPQNTQPTANADRTAQFNNANYTPHNGSHGNMSAQASHNSVNNANNNNFNRNANKAMPMEMTAPDAPEQPAEAGMKKKNPAIVIVPVIVALVIVIAIAGIFIAFKFSGNFDSESVQKQHFSFMPDNEIGEVLNLTHNNPDGSKKPVWKDVENDKGKISEVEFEGVNIYDGTKVFITFTKGTRKSPEISYAKIGGEKAGERDVEKYVLSAYDQYKSGKRPASTTVPATTESTTTTTTTVTTVNYQMHDPLSFIGNNLGEVKDEYGTPDKISIRDDENRQYEVYEYEGIQFEYVIVDNEASVKIKADDKTPVSGIHFNAPGIVNDNISVGMTYSQLSKTISFSDSSVSIDSSTNKMTAKGKLKVYSKEFSAVVSFENADLGQTDVADLKSDSLYIYDTSTADKYVYDHVEKPTENKAAVTSDEAYKGTIKLDDGYLNVREKADKNGKIVGKLYKGDEVTVDEVSRDWYHITCGDIKGYVHSDYLNSAYKEYIKLMKNVYNEYDGYNMVFFHDIDKDGTTEMILEKSTCEADAIFEYYTAEKGKAVYLGSSSAFHIAGIYETKDKALLIQHIQMGAEMLETVRKSGNNIIVETTQEFTETEDYSISETPVKTNILSDYFG